MLWSCLVLPLLLVKSSLHFVASWLNAQVYTTCIQFAFGLFSRNLNLSMPYPYSLFCGSVSPSILESGPADLLALLSVIPLFSYFLLRSCMSWFHCSGGFSGRLHRRFGLDCPRLRALEFPTAVHHPIQKRRRYRRRYHRHYHRRVKFLHHPRPKCPKLPQPVVQPSRFAVLSRRPIAAASRWSSLAYQHASILCSWLVQLPGLPVFLASMSYVFSQTFLIRASLTHLAACYLLTTGYLAWCSRSKPFSFTFNYSDDDDFGSELPLSVQEGDSSVCDVDRSRDTSSLSWSNDTILDLFCCIQAQSRFDQSSTRPSSAWDSIHPLHSLDLTVPGLDHFISSIDILSDSNALMAEEWASIAPVPSSSFENIVPAAALDTFVRGIDPLLYHRVLSLDFGLASTPSFSAHYNSDPMSKSHVFLSKSEKSHLPIVIDTGASRSISPCRADFVSFQKYSSKIEGIGSSTEVAGKGLVKWKITDQHDKTKEIITFAYYIPSASIRLYSPQAHFAESKSGRLSCSWNEVRLYLPSPVNPDSSTPLVPHDDDSNDYLSFPYHPHSNLPCMLPSNHPAFLRHYLPCLKSIAFLLLRTFVGSLLLKMLKPWQIQAFGPFSCKVTI